MVNNDRIVPIQKIDFLSMIGTVLCLGGQGLTVLAPETDKGDFEVDSASGYCLANQPVHAMEVTELADGATVFFVAAYDFAGVTVAGSPVNADLVAPDGITLYKLSLVSTTPTIAAVTPSLA